MFTNNVCNVSGCSCTKAYAGIPAPGSNYPSLVAGIPPLGSSYPSPDSSYPFLPAIIYEAIFADCRGANSSRHKIGARGKAFYFDETITWLDSDHVVVVVCLQSRITFPFLCSTPYLALVLNIQTFRAILNSMCDARHWPCYRQIHRCIIFSYQRESLLWKRSRKRRPVDRLPSDTDGRNGWVFIIARFFSCSDATGHATASSNQQEARITVGRWSYRFRRTVTLLSPILSLLMVSSRSLVFS